MNFTIDHAFRVAITILALSFMAGVVAIISVSFNLLQQNQDIITEIRVDQQNNRELLQSEHATLNCILLITPIERTFENVDNCRRKAE